MPGQVYYEATREAVLRRADGLVFVADSQASRKEDNLSSWRDMQRHLAKMGHQLSAFPVVVQLNKRDLPDALPVEEMKAMLGGGQHPYFPAIALQGTGVPKTLQAVMRLVLADVQRKISVKTKGAPAR